jgi:hypothetical protein
MISAVVAAIAVALIALFFGVVGNLLSDRIKPLS